MAKRSKPSLLDQVASQEAAAPSLFSNEEITIEKVGKPEFTGTSTGERLHEQNPELYRIVKHLLGQGSGIREIMRITGLHHRTIMAVRTREGETIDTLRRRMAEGHFSVAELGVELLEEAFTQGTIHGEPVKMKVGEIAMAAGVATDKGQNLSGGITSRIEHVQGPTVDDYMRMISGKVIEAELVPATGFEGEEVAQKSSDPGAAVQAGPAAVQAEPLEVAAAGAESGLVLALPSAAVIPTGSPENPATPDEQSGVQEGSISVEAQPATHLDTHSASFEAVEDGQPATQEPAQRVEDAGTTHEATTTTGEREQAPRPRTEGGRGSAKSRRVSGGH
jgi:hypothetical protein